MLGQFKKKKIKKLDFQENNILYQKLGKYWYSFTDHNGKVFITKLNEEKVLKKVYPTHDSQGA